MCSWRQTAIVLLENQIKTVCHLGHQMIFFLPRSHHTPALMLAGSVLTSGLAAAVRQNMKCVSPLAEAPVVRRLVLTCIVEVKAQISLCVALL